MTWNFFSFLLTNEEAEAFVQFNTNILETNLVNILILIGLLVYGNKISFSKGLKIVKKKLFKLLKMPKKM